MITVRQIERYWNARKYEKLFDELISFRAEASFHVDFESTRSASAAAVALIRLEELNQGHVPLYAKLVRALVATQDQSDGGWGDPVTTALCVRALLAGRGNGATVERGLEYLAALQKDEGIWPAGPIRRLEADPYVSAFILYQLGDSPRFRSAVRFFDALGWFEQHEGRLDEGTLELWERASLRCGLRLATQYPELAVWS